MPRITNLQGSLMPAETVQQLRGDALTSLATASDLAALDAWRIEYLGRKGRLTSVLRGLAELSIDERKQVGAAANALKDELEQRFEARSEEVRGANLARALETGRIDVTLPARPRPKGGLHPVTQLVLLAPAVEDVLARFGDPILVDCGAGKGYLGFVLYELFLKPAGKGNLVSIESRPDLARAAAERARRLGYDRMSFVESDIASADVPPRVQLVTALHACDTATDDALARAVLWDAGLVLAAPCCHHDVAAQLRRTPTPAPYSLLTRHGILRERFADTLTDALRAGVLRLLGYRVDVIEFVESQHTPRNTLLRATRTGAAPSSAVREEYEDLVRTWNVHPRLAELLAERLDSRLHEPAQ